MTESIKVNVFSARAYVDLPDGDQVCVTWCILVCSVVRQATEDEMVGVEYAAVCNENQDIFQELGIPP